MVLLGTCTSAEIKIGVYTRHRITREASERLPDGGGCWSVWSFSCAGLHAGRHPGFGMPARVELGAETNHSRTSRPIHQGRCGDAGTEAQVVARTASRISIAVRLEIAGSLEEEAQLHTQGSGKLTETVCNNVAVRNTP